MDVGHMLLHTSAGSLPRKLSFRGHSMVQVGPDVTDAEFVQMFRTYGPLRSHRLIRKSNCAFVDFMHLEDAAAAREALPGARLASNNVRVEFKVALSAAIGCAWQACGRS